MSPVKFPTRRSRARRAYDAIESWGSKHHWQAFMVAVLIVCLVNAVTEN